MTQSSQRVDFYLLSDTQDIAKYQTACRIVEKAYHQNNRIFILTENQTDTDQLNQLLWTFNDISFIPHADFPDEEISVLINHEILSVTNYNILVNLTPEFPDNFNNFNNFNRIIEIINNNPDSKQKARNKYKIYREKNCELHSHQLNIKF